MMGLAELPPVIQRLLDEAATNAAAAATALERLVEHRGRTALRDEVVRLEGEGDRIVHDLRRELSRRLIADIDRAPLLRLSEAIDDVVDATEASAHAVAVYADALPPAKLEAISSTVRDLVRATTRAIAFWNATEAERQPSQARARELRDEAAWRLRDARRHVVADQADPLCAIRASRLVTPFEAIRAACGEALNAAALVTLTRS